MLEDIGLFFAVWFIGTIGVLIGGTAAISLIAFICWEKDYLLDMYSDGGALLILRFSVVASLIATIGVMFIP